MSLRLIERDPADIPTPDAGKKWLFLNSVTGEPCTKDSAGTVESLIGADGAPGPTGDAGADGDPGADGADGLGVPAGGTTGQVLSKVSGADNDTEWADPAGGSGTVVPSICGGRLTLETGVPVSTTDQTAKTTIYWTPFRGAMVALYSGSAWVLRAFSETSLALGTLTSGKNYDVFAYDNAGTLALELSAAWTNDTTRADALALQDGVLCKSGTLTRRYLGTFRTTSTTTTEDSLAKRFLYSYYHRARRKMKAVDTANTWVYTTATFRQANANAANQLAYVVGVNEDSVTATVKALADNTSTNIVGAVGVGVDSTSVNSADLYGGSNFSQVPTELHAYYEGMPGIGYHFLAWLEYSVATGTTAWYGDAGLAVIQSGMIGALWN